MSRKQNRHIALTRTVRHQQGDVTEIEWYKFEMDLVVEKIDAFFYAEVAELGAGCTGGGKSVDDAVMDFVEGFMALVELHTDADTLTSFFERNFPNAQPSRSSAKFDDPPDESLIAPWMVSGAKEVGYALAS